MLNKANEEALRNRQKLTAKRREISDEAGKTLDFFGSAPLALLLSDFSKMNDTKTDDKQDDTDPAKLDYYAKTKSLNESVSKWIKTHVEADPVCDLTLVFKDYSNHLKKIEGKKEGQQKIPQNGRKTPSTNCTLALGNFKFGGDSTLNESSVKKGFIWLNG
jgi:hypothetical protein